jgi:3-hydroxy-9,10-secoandrosta-1,3,5(10)-triene-9,17-dione monooxygenase reductase component
VEGTEGTGCMERNIQTPSPTGRDHAASRLGHELIASFRRTAGHFATGVAILTSFDEDEPIGMTVQSFTSVSLEPLLVSLALSRTSATWPRIRASGQVCINILASDQEELSRHFARSVADRFADVTWTVNANGLPVLGSVLAWLDCVIEDTQVAGDHEVALCAVRDLAVSRADAEPLLFFRGAYTGLSAGRTEGFDSVAGLPPAW